MGNPIASRNNGVNKKNKDESFEDESTCNMKLWLALIFILISAGVILLFWFIRGSVFQDSAATRVEDTHHMAVEKPLESYEAIKEKLIKERERSQPRENQEVMSEEIVEESVTPLPPPSSTFDNYHQESKNLFNDRYGMGASEHGVFSTKPIQSPKIKGGGKDDTVVRIAFIDSLATWMVKNYTPPAKSAKSGSLNITLQSLNMRYGVDMIGLSCKGEDPQLGRSSILRYVFTPSMIDALYRLYVDRFMSALSRELSVPRHGKVLTLQQKQAFYRLYATQFHSISSTLQGIAAIPNFVQKVDEVKLAAKRVVDTNTKYINLVNCTDKCRELGNKQEFQQLTKKTAAASKAYQQAIIARERMVKALILSIRQHTTTRTLDDSNILFLANWVYRRLKNQTGNIDAVLQASTMFLDLAKRFEMTSGIIRHNE